MELYLLKFYKIPGKIATRSFWTVPERDSCSLYFILYGEMLTLPLPT